MTRLFFIIGLRRSGTSILRTLMSKHPEISGIEFEPHPLWNAVDLNHFKRFKHLDYVKKTINDFESKSSDKWYGAKFALNPGTKALEWIWLHKTFPEARFIFIRRTLVDTFNSVHKQDVNSVRGIIDEKAYYILASNLIMDFTRFAQNKKMACIIKFEELVRDADNTLIPVWNLLGVKQMKGFNDNMRKPTNWSSVER